MNTPRNSFLIILGVGLIFGFILLLQFLDPGTEEYILQVQKDRKAKDEWFRTHPDSPMDEANRAIFKGLNYFDVDPNWRVVATLEPNPRYEKVEMPRTNGTPETYLVAGKLKFRKAGIDHVLTAYQPNDKDSKTLFIPFRDLTSGKDSYGGGRYLDVRAAENNRVNLDFNQAYNPYCVFNITMICPIPPAENTLQVEVKAGERSYEIKMPAAK